MWFRNGERPWALLLVQASAPAFLFLLVLQSHRQEMYLADLPLYRIRLLSRNIHIQNYTKLILGAFAFLQITCLDISSGGGLGVSASTDGTMKIWQAANGEIRVRAFGLGALCCL